MAGYSIVVVTTNHNHKYLFPCLESLSRNSQGTIEIVLVINGPQKESKAIGEAFNCKIIELDDVTYFSRAYNIGMSHATGKYLFVANDDVLFTPGWNILMSDCMRRFHRLHDHPEAALVGPASNYVGGLQQVPETVGRVTPLNVDDFSAIFTKSNADKWTPTNFVSGFCEMINRKYYDKHKPEIFDERFVQGAEDNMLSLKATMDGWSVVICSDCFIYHHGEKTVSKTHPDNWGGVKNLLDYYKLGREELLPVSKVAGACRVRLLNAEHAKIFLLSLSRMVNIVDCIAIVNDRSKVWPKDEVAAILGKAEHIIHEFKRGHDEYRDRQKLLDLARDMGANWYLSWDSDEIFEDKFDKAYVDRLVNPPRPDMAGYLFHWYTFWDASASLWRTDSTFGQMYGERLTRILPGRNMHKNESGLHMGNVPGVGMIGGNRITSVRVKHYGFTSKTERERKRDFYEGIDKVKDVMEIGFADYSHLVDESVGVAPWMEKSDITIGTIVKNEEKRLHNYLWNVWPFADEMIFVDTGSTDNTIGLLEHWGAKVIKYDKPWTRDEYDFSAARNMVLKEVKTKWFWHIDADETIQQSDQIREPLTHVRRMIDLNPMIGYQFMFTNPYNNSEPSESQCTRLVQDVDNMYYTGVSHETLDEACEEKKVGFCPVRFVNTGWLIPPEEEKEKLKKYLRGNLRMIRDFPDDPRGWFNAGLHMFDCDFNAAGLEFVVQSLSRKEDFALARKELVLHTLDEVWAHLGEISKVAPNGHPLWEYAQAAGAAIKDFKGQSGEKRHPEHVFEVLAEPEFESTKQLVLKLQSLDGLPDIGGLD